MGTEVAETTGGTDLAELEAQESALAAGIKSKIDRDDMILPQVRLSNALSQAVAEGDAKAGDFINTLTGENYGKSFSLVIVDYFKGRFFSPEDDDRTYVAIGDVAPNNWPDEYAGKAFADLPDAEEQFKAAANDPENPQQWGDGPPIRTTYNYVGFVAAEDASEIPVRLSLQRTSVPTARKINTLIDVARTPWDKVFEVRAVEQSNAKNQKYFAADVKLGPATTPEQRSKAVQLATSLQKANIQLHGDAPDDGEDPKGEKPETPEGAPEV